MQTSARNQLRGTVQTVTIGAVMAEVVVDVSGQQIVAAITGRLEPGQDLDSVARLVRGLDARPRV
jgi:molybdopterin-binding protein